MTIDNTIISDLCTDAAFKRSQGYCADGRIRQIDRFGEVVMAKVQGSPLYGILREFLGQGLAGRPEIFDLFLAHF